MTDRELRQLRSLPIEAVAERLGLRVVRHRALCPYHDDHHPSLSFHERTNTFRCWSCGAHGDVIDLARRVLGKDFLDTCRWLANGYCILREPRVSRPDGQSKVALRLPFDADKYGRYLLHPWLSDEARHFLYDERHIDPRVVRWARLTSWRDKGGIHWLTIPYFDIEGKLIGIQFRNLEWKKAVSEEGGRFRFPLGSRCHVYNLPVIPRLHDGDELWIMEGCSDCWAMLSSGRKAIAIPSATLLKDNELAAALAPLKGRELSYHMYPDRDAPGEALYLHLKCLLPSLQRHLLPDGCKDFADYWVSLRKAKFI